MSDAVAALYSGIADRLIAAMEAGSLPWRRPWRGGGALLPLRSTGEPYRGINTLMLWIVAEDRGYSAPHWFTYRQAQALGAQVRRAEKGSKVLKYGTVEKTDSGAPRAEPERISFARVYTVFNACQIDGLPEAYRVPDPEGAEGPAPVPEYERFFAATGMTTEIGGTVACYRPATDTVHMPPHVLFEEAHGFYRVLAHEGCHWSGHASRLDRFPAERTPDSYAREELVAELGACFLGARIGLEPAEAEAASYLDHWISILREGPRELRAAVTAAQAAADFLISAAGPAALPGSARPAST